MGGGGEGDGEGSSRGCNALTGMQNPTVTFDVGSSP